MKRFFLGALVLVACGRSSWDASAEQSGPIGQGVAALSFSGGNNGGYSAANGAKVPNHTLVLTFDDGPGSRTLELSSYLKSQGIRAIFFVNGRSFGSDPDALLSQVVADGHLVGNHTQNHLDMTTLGDDEIFSEVADTDAIIASHVPPGLFFFRAPFGAWSSHDYDVLQSSSMSKYQGPVKWDIGGVMTSRYAADWDCWQNADGYGVLTTSQCGDRYLNEMNDVGRGIVLMHDADYGTATGNTIDMVKYLVPRLKSQGWSFLRIDEAIGGAPPDGGGGGHDGGAGDGGAGDGGACAFDPTWHQTTYANEWWVEYEISGSITAASLEVVGRQTVTLQKQYDKWVGGPSAAIASGTQVVLHASNASASVVTAPFRYLVDASPETACGSSPPPPPPPPPSSCFETTWSQGGGANTWWVEYALGSAATSVFLEVPGRGTVALTKQASKWTGPTPFAIAAGTSVVAHATNASGAAAATKPFGYLNVTKPASAPCK